MPPTDGTDPGDILRSVPLLLRLDSEDRRALARMGQSRRYARNTTVFHEDDPGDSLHVIVEGHVAVTKVSDEGAETVLETFAPGDCFGELALLDGLPRSGTATATEPTIAIVVTRADFLDWLTSRPTAALALLETLSRNLRATSSRMTDRIFLGLTQRLIKELLRADEDTGPLLVRRTQAELGTVLGVSRESINKTLRGLETRGLLTLGRGRIHIPDPSRLRELI